MLSELTGCPNRATAHVTPARSRKNSPLAPQGDALQDRLFDTPPAVASIAANSVLLLNGECLGVMAKMTSGSVDLILTDLPYGVSQNKWDSVISLPDMWAEFHRILKPNGAIVLTATQPFTSLLVSSNIKHFKYEWIWEKTVGSGQLNIKYQPLRKHESILVFYKKPPTYNEQLGEGKPYTIARDLSGDGYGKQTASSKVNTGYRHPGTVLRFPNPRIKGGHPTQKPVALMEYLIKTYSNAGDVVLDCCMGSGTTGVAAKASERAFVGIELDSTYFEHANGRILLAP